MKTPQTNDLITSRNENNNTTLTGRITEIDGSNIYIVVEGVEFIIDEDQIVENLGAEVSAETSLHERINQLPINPIINKQLKTAWKIVYPSGTMPRANAKVKEEVLFYLERFIAGTNPDFIEDKKEAFISYLETISE